MKRFLFALVLMITQSVIAFDHSYSDYAHVLDMFVEEGQVNYEGIKQQPYALDRFLKQAEQVTQDEFEEWPNHYQQAFLLNLHNAVLLKMISKRYPLKSVKEIGWALKGAWDKREFKLFGDKASLDMLRDDFLWKKYRDPLLFFGLCTASRHGPRMLKEPYHPFTLQTQLVDQVVRILQDPTQMRIDHSRRLATLPPIFKKEKSIFKRKGKRMADFILPFLAAQDRKKMSKGRFHKYTLEYSDFDWRLNDTL